MVRSHYIYNEIGRVTVLCIFTEDLEWPEEEEWQVRDDAKDLITNLLQYNPINRLGLGGALEVKEHPFFYGLDWDGLLRKKAEFVPNLDDDEDTSYFDRKFQHLSHSSFVFS